MTEGKKFPVQPRAILDILIERVDSRVEWGLDIRNGVRSVRACLDAGVEEAGEQIIQCHA